MKNLIEESGLRNASLVFEDRMDAGRRLAQLLSPFRGADAIVLAIPSGGVPVGMEIKTALRLAFDLLVVRKIQVPWDTEAGFGAVNLDGETIWNEDLLRSLRLSPDIIRQQTDKTKEILRTREALFRKGRPFPSLKKKTAILVDDGVASGYSMMVGVQFVRKREPSHLVVAVPTGSFRNLQRISPLADALYCLNVREGFPFAVADAYRHWYDMSHKEVVALLDREG